MSDDYESVIIPTNLSVVDINLKQNVLSNLRSFVQYGKWPIPAVRNDSNRGNPFELKSR